MDSASPPLHDVVGSVHALMEVMKEIAVSFINLNCLHVHVHVISNSKYLCSHFPFSPLSCPLNQLLQFPAQLEHFGATTASVFLPLPAVMGYETAQMAVMRLDVSSD